MNMRLVWISGFGLAGVLLRYVGIRAMAFILPPFPFGTFAINITGSFLAGALYVAAVEKGAVSEDLRIGLLVGLLGGFTTFSSFSLETIRLFQSESYLIGSVYLLGSPVIGVLAAYLGILSVRAL